MRVLVTGGLGFVGRHLAVRYAEMGHDVTVVDSMEAGTGCVDLSRWREIMGVREDVTRAIVYSRCDCREWFLSRAAHASWDLAFHCAAIVGGRRTIDGVPLWISENLGIDAAMWRWAERAMPGRVVYFSSSAAYPVRLQTESYVRLRGRYRMVERDLRWEDGFLEMPDSVYGWAKVTGEMLAARSSVSHVIYRPFSGYGSDQGADYPMGAICARALAAPPDSRQIHVWGPGTQVRDWIHMSDICRMVEHTCQRVPSGTALNLCTGVGTSMIDIARTAMVCASDGRLSVEEIQVVGTPDMPTGVHHRVGDPSLLHQHVSPATVPVSTGVADVVSHIRRVSS